MSRDEPPTSATAHARDSEVRPEGERMESSPPVNPLQGAHEDTALLHELVEHLRASRTELREQWTRRITEADLLNVMSSDEVFTEVTAVYDNYVDALETGSVQALQDYARDLSEG